MQPSHSCRGIADPGLQWPAARRPVSRRRVSLAIGAIVLAALLGSCARPAPLVISVAESEVALWEDTLAATPLPEGFAVETFSPADPPAERSAAITVSTRRGPLPAPAAGAVLRATWLAPARYLWEPPASSPGAAASRSEELDLLPLSAIELPRVAVSVNGRYPDDPDYPLVEFVLAELDESELGLDPEDERLLAIRAWFASLPERREPPEVSWVGAVGDMMFERGVTELLDRADGLEHVFGDVLPHLQEVDLLLGNLEGAVTTGGVEAAKTFTFRFHPRVLPRLAEAGFDYLSVVNNHSYDYGESGFRDTLAHLAASPIATSGAGLTPEEARAPFTRTLSDTQVRVLSVGAYPVERNGFDGARSTTVSDTRAGVLWAEPRNPAALEFSLQAMRDAFGPETLDIVMVHGGAEWATAPSETQRALYRSYVDHGADVVVGHHSHVTQGLEVYNGALIAYSMGNFIFPGMYLTQYGEESMVLRLGYADAAVRYVELLPVRIDHQRIAIDPQPDALDRVYAGTRRLNSVEDQ